MLGTTLNLAVTIAIHVLFVALGFIPRSASLILMATLVAAGAIAAMNSLPSWFVLEAVDLFLVGVFRTVRLRPSHPNRSQRNEQQTMQISGDSNGSPACWSPSP